MAFFRRFPNREQLTPVYAVIVIVVYGKAIFDFFWQLPSWLYFMSAGEILTQFAYQLTTNLIESLILLLFPIFLGAILPRRWFNDSFVAQGTILMLFILGFLIYIASQFTHVESYPGTLLKYSPLIFTLIILLSFLLGRIALLRRLVETVADRAIIFLYVIVPLSILALLDVIFRNLV